MDKNDSFLLAGCVILYHPDKAIIENIKSYVQFLGVLYVIDNTNEPDDTIVGAIRSIGNRIVYIPQLDNIGVASALNKAAKLARNANYNWLLTMDQDSGFPDAGFFNSWKATVAENDKIGIIAASYTDNYDRWHKAYSAAYLEIHFAVTSGNIISLNKWEAVGGFEDRLFIDEVDHDYCLKLRQHGCLILTSKAIWLGHMVGEFHQKTSAKIVIHAPVRYYYMARNVLYVCKKYFFTDIRFAAGRFWYLIKMLAKIILRYPDKATYLKFFFTGVGDFIKSKYNKYSK